MNKWIAVDKPIHEVTNWSIGIRKIATGLIVCLDATMPDGKNVWTSSILFMHGKKQFCETVNSLYVLKGPMNEEFRAILGHSTLDKYVKKLRRKIANG